MEFYSNCYYHVYNRANSNNDILFVEKENYLFFLRKYRNYLSDLVETLCYCLLPNHFHFFVRVRDLPEKDLKGFKNLSDLGDGRRMDVNQAISNFLNSYTKSFNNMYARRGSLFEKPSKAKLIENEAYFINLIRYIHRNPVHHHFVSELDNWEYSSYWEYLGRQHGTLPVTANILQQFNSLADFRQFTECDLHDSCVEPYILE